MFVNMERTIILASTSPRRRELLKQLDLPFRIADPFDYDETYPPSMPPRSVPTYLSQIKSKAYKKPIGEHELLLTADTIVVLGEEVIGKPKDRADARKILQKLSGNCHTVLTGVTLRGTKLSRSFSVSSDVFFRRLTDEQIDYYLDNYKPYDKAGAYGVQEWLGMIAIERIEGSFYNVVGLPTSRLMHEINRFTF